MLIFRFMVINYVNVLIRGTEIEEKFKDKEVKRDWYYPTTGGCAGARASKRRTSRRWR